MCAAKIVAERVPPLLSTRETYRMGEREEIALLLPRKHSPSTVCSRHIIHIWKKYWKWNARWMSLKYVWNSVGKSAPSFTTTTCAIHHFWHSYHHSFHRSSYHSFYIMNMCVRVSWDCQHCDRYESFHCESLLCVACVWFIEIGWNSEYPLSLEDEMFCFVLTRRIRSKKRWQSNPKSYLIHDGL